MYIRNIIRNPFVYAVLSVLTLGLFAHIYLIYLVFRLKTYNTFVNRPLVAVYVILIVARFYELFLLLFLAAQWFTIPNKLEDKREYANIEGDISWKIGLVPTIAVFYTLGFLLFQAPFSDLAQKTISHFFGNYIRLTPTSEISNTTVFAVGIPMLISVCLAIGYWVLVVSSKYKDYIDNREIKAIELKEEREIRKEQRNLLENLKPNKPEELPMLELADFEINTQDFAYKNEDKLSGNTEFTLKFDDEEDDFDF